MQQIADWLEKLGLSEYVQRFAENGIDISVLRYLTDQDLKDIGVLLGHRRKMLAAISELTDATPVTSDAAALEAQREHCEAGRRLYDPQRHRPHRLLYGGHDPGVCAGYLGALLAARLSRQGVGDR
jgi:hypothetical protein